MSTGVWVLRLRKTDFSPQIRCSDHCSWRVERVHGLTAPRSDLRLGLRHPKGAGLSVTGPRTDPSAFSLLRHVLTSGPAQEEMMLLSPKHWHHDGEDHNGRLPPEDKPGNRRKRHQEQRCQSRLVRLREGQRPQSRRLGYLEHDSSHADCPGRARPEIPLSRAASCCLPSTAILPVQNLELAHARRRRNAAATGPGSIALSHRYPDIS